ncbi:Tad domain-containing protein [Caldanaerobacter subterraneus]|uniref:Tad domain-containing protein n=1 Tax=Caldanaerobacter subterraneus TaxID=911092 RepID=A0A7Y2L8H9_9THEO|nr:Tad domain-containing protein [Caldanaerobacter subterraneus]
MINIRRIFNEKGDIYLFLLVGIVPIILIMVMITVGVFSFYHARSQMQNLLDVSVTSAVNDAMNDMYRQEYKGKISSDYVREKIYNYLERNFKLNTDLTPKKESILTNPLVIEYLHIQESPPKVEIEVSSIRSITIWSGMSVSIPVPAKTIVENIRTDGK